MKKKTKTLPIGTTGIIMLHDGRIISGKAVGPQSYAIGELCFNTSMTGYQEILSDPSYAQQIVTFTTPHIGNIGINPQDMESTKPMVKGCITASPLSEPSNYRAEGRLQDWLCRYHLIGITHIDTRALTRYIRKSGAPNILIAHHQEGHFDIPALHEKLLTWKGIENCDLAQTVSCAKPYQWQGASFDFQKNDFQESAKIKRHVVAIDYGAKHNMLRQLAHLECRVTVVPMKTSAEDILQLKPDGIFLSNGPGDPAASAQITSIILQQLIQSNIPIFGICLGHQLLGLAMGAKTQKMHFGHHGANHPVKNLETGRVEITSQNHGFTIDSASVPENLKVTHRSLFDHTIEGIADRKHPVFSVQYHPEASPGPHDSHYLFHHFVDLIDQKAFAA